ncbi:aspartic peptidase domain-containing protein [Xylariaceae sp. FL1651]|nr:aspartic peptidase domain-containing protein [Xylariaceae sp. FL1651]
MALMHLCWALLVVQAICHALAEEKSHAQIDNASLKPKLLSFLRVPGPQRREVVRREQDIQLFGNSTSSSYYIQHGHTGDIEYYTDKVTLSTGLQISDVQFGVTINNTGFESGILGLGYGESANTNYSNFVDQLASQGITNNKAFSLALGNTTTPNSGVVIFGGIDMKKFSGSLVSNDIIASDTGYSSYTISMAGVGSGTWGGSTTNIANTNTTVLLDSGTTLSYLSTNVINGLAVVFNATYNESVAGYTAPCSVMQNEDSFVAFNFAEVIIRVPFSNLVFPLEDHTCFWGIQESFNNGDVLGLSFLRNAYTVYDQTLSTISLAQYVDCCQNEQEIPTGGASGFMGECSSATLTMPSGGATPSPSPLPTSSSSSRPANGLTTGAKVRIGVGVGVGAPVIAAIAFLIIASWRRRQAAHSTESA